MAFHWQADDCSAIRSFVIFQGIQTSTAKELYSSVIFQWGPDPPVLPLDPRMLTFHHLITKVPKLISSYVYTSLSCIMDCNVALGNVVTTRMHRVKQKQSILQKNLRNMRALINL